MKQQQHDQTLELPAQNLWHQHSRGIDRRKAAFLAELPIHYVENDEPDRHAGVCKAITGEEWTRAAELARRGMAPWCTIDQQQVLVL